MTSPSTVRPMATERDAEAFGRLNRAWITELFALTDEDERVLSQPFAAIVRPGGEVLVAEDEVGAILGTIALMSAGDQVFELAKMTVAPDARGRGIGGQLVGAATDWAAKRGARMVFLGTNTKLAPAIRLYEAAGFERTTVEELRLVDYYSRANVLMKLEIDREA